MSDFKVPTEEQRSLLMECDIDPEGYVVRTDNDRSMCVLHLKTRNEILIMKNERMRIRGNQ